MPSSVIEAMRYDTRWRVLTIWFRGSGEVYQYFAVPRSVWEAFATAPSKGTYLNATFKHMNFRYELVDRPALDIIPAEGDTEEGKLLRWPSL